MRYLLSQSLVLPMLWSSIVVLILHVPVCWAYLFKLGFRAAGAALAIGISYTLNVILLGVYVYHSKACEKTLVVCSGDVFLSIKEFFCFAVPSAVMICTRVSNELGAENPEAARRALLAVSVLEAVEVIIAIITLFSSRSVLGYAFGNDNELVDYVKDMTLLLCFSIFADTIQTILSGVARGTGWKHIGAYINLGSYYLVGIPLALVLGFVLHFKGHGLWSGLIVGIVMQCILFTIVTCFTNWEKQARKAKERMSEGEIIDDE